VTASAARAQSIPIASSERTSTPHLSLWPFTALMLPSFIIGMMAAPVGAILPAFYAKYTRLSLATIGSVLLATRILDALSDQVVGYFSDSTLERFGRKSWILAGALLSMLATAFLFNPPTAATTFFLFVWLSIYYVGWTMVSVPHAAWASELTGDYLERSRIFSFISAVGPLGVIVIFGVPLLPAYKDSAVTPASVSFMGWLIIVSLPVCCGLPALLTPRGRSLATHPPGLASLWRSVSSNRLFWWFITYSLLAAISTGVVSTLVVFYLDKYLGMGRLLSPVFIANMLLLMLAIPMWLKLIAAIGKHRALALASLCQMVLYPMLLLISPGKHAFVLFFAWVILLGLTGAALTIVPRAILADIIDYDTWKTGGHHAGNYYAFLGLTEKAVGSLGGAIALFLLVLLGFDPKADTMTPQAKFALLSTMGVFPAVLCFIVFVMVWTYPLTAKHHAAIRRRIERRAQRAARMSTGTP
jgi:glycoside/pentoside/hexuronide:cation symporter, GPH family